MATGKLSLVPRDIHYSCAEVVEVSWQATSGDEYGECAVLAEIWNHGGIFLVDAPAEPGTQVRISLPHATLSGTVARCWRERHSFALDLQVNAAEEWFGGRYDPMVLTPEAPNPVAGAVRPTGPELPFGMARAEEARQIHPRTL